MGSRHLAAPQGHDLESAAADRGPLLLDRSPPRQLEVLKVVIEAAVGQPGCPAPVLKVVLDPCPCLEAKWLKKPRLLPAEEGKVCRREAEVAAELDQGPPGRLHRCPRVRAAPYQNPEARHRREGDATLKLWVVAETQGLLGVLGPRLVEYILPVAVPLDVAGHARDQPVVPFLSNQKVVGLPAGLPGRAARGLEGREERMREERVLLRASHGTRVPILSGDPVNARGDLCAGESRRQPPLCACTPIKSKLEEEPELFARYNRKTRLYDDST